MTTNEHDLNTFLAIASEVSFVEAMESRKSPQLRRRAHALAELAHDRIAELRRAEHNEPARIASGAVRPTILAMTRDAVLARLRELWTFHPEMQLAHRDFVEMSDNDLRSVLEDAESMLASRG